MLHSSSCAFLSNLLMASNEIACKTEWSCKLLIACPQPIENHQHIAVAYDMKPRLISHIHALSLLVDMSPEIWVVKCRALEMSAQPAIVPDHVNERTHRILMMAGTTPREAFRFSGSALPLELQRRATKWLQTEETTRNPPPIPSTSKTRLPRHAIRRKTPPPPLRNCSRSAPMRRRTLRSEAYW